MKEKTIPSFRIFSFLLASFIVGVFCSSFNQTDNLTLSVEIFALVLVAQIAISIAFGTKKILFILAFCSLFFSAGWLCFSSKQNKLDRQQLPYGQKIETIGKIVNVPEPETNSQKFFVYTEELDTRIYVSTSKYPSYKYGDSIKINGRLDKPTNYSNFDWINYLKRFGSTSQIKNPEIVLISSGKGNQLLASLYNFRKKFESTVQRSLPEPESSLAAGLLIGSKQGFSDSLLAKFSKVGVTHIIALSGFNVTIIIIFLTELMLGYIDKRKIFFLSTMLIITFVAMTGAAPSVIRASIITLLITFGKTIGRRADMANLILLSGAIMVILNPYILRFDLGFQLSYLAFVGLIYFSPIIKKMFNKKPFAKIPLTIKTTLIETLSAQILVLPLILYSFGMISIISPVANILILPLIPASMLFIFISSILYWIATPIGHLAFLISYLPLKYIIDLVNFSSKLPLASISIPEVYKNISTLGLVIVISVFIYLNREIYAKEIN